MAGRIVFGSFVYLQDEPLTKLKVEEALRQAGFDFKACNALTDHSVLADGPQSTILDWARTAGKSTERTLEVWEL